MRLVIGVGMLLQKLDVNGRFWPARTSPEVFSGEEMGEVFKLWREPYVRLTFIFLLTVVAVVVVGMKREQRVRCESF